MIDVFLYSNVFKWDVYNLYILMGFEIKIPTN